MAIIQELGKLLLFIIVMAYPHQKKIQSELKKKQSIIGWPNIIAHIFEQKKKILKDL